MELIRLYDQDLKDRDETKGSIDWNVLVKADAARRLRVRALLDQGLLHTAKDFERAALIFQHGSSADDYLLAHCLAMIAASLGDTDARWLSAATLDRYLWASGKSQIFGTQFQGNAQDLLTQDPFDPKLLSEAMREKSAVVGIARQKQILDGMNKKK